MWKIDRPSIAPGWLAFEPEQVLDEYDFPTLFTLKGGDGDLYLAYHCGNNPDGVRFLVVSTTADLVRQLVTGRCSLCTALVSGRMWVFDVGRDWSPLRCWPVDLSAVPWGTLPKPWVMLRHDMKPVCHSHVLKSAATTQRETAAVVGPQARSGSMTWRGPFTSSAAPGSALTARATC